MRVGLLWGHDATVAQFVADQFDHIDSFGPSAKAVGFATRRGQSVVLYGGLVMVERDGGWDAELSIFIWPGAVVSRKQWAAMFHHGFDVLGLRRLTVMVGEHNVQSQRFVRRLGFKFEGVARRGHDGNSDAILYGMTRDDCRWIHGISPQNQ